MFAMAEHEPEGEKIAYRFMGVIVNAVIYGGVAAVCAAFLYPISPIVAAIFAFFVVVVGCYAMFGSSKVALVLSVPGDAIARLVHYFGLGGF